MGGAQNFGGLVGGAIAPMVTGWFVLVTGSFVAALATTAATSRPLGALIHLVRRQPADSRGGRALSW